MQKIGKNVYVETGFMGCNCGFVVTKEGVVMIDTPQMPADAVKWRDEIARHGKVKYLINTEPHGDHFSGNFYFEGTVIGHEGVREAILATPPEQIQRMAQMDPANLPLIKDYKYRPPTITLSQRLTLHLGDHTFRLTNLPGHTPYQVAVHIPEEKVVFTSDNIFHKTHPFLHQAVPYEWIESLKKMEEMEADFLVPGHGEVCDKSYLPVMSAIIKDWIDTVKAAIDKGISLEEAQEKISLLDRYPMEPGREAMGKDLQRMNVARLYEVLKK
jgi:cyclase